MSFKKVYCCTPVAFCADEHYFIRDTGLICRNLLTMGIESKCIMPLPYHDEDQRENLIRTEFSNLESPEWWKSLEIDALVLYSWGAPRYRKIARAVHKAGIYLVIHMDTSGDFEGSDWENLSVIKKVFRYARVKVADVLRSRHLSYANIITAGEPVLDAISKRPFYGEWVKERGVPLASPVSSQCIYDGCDKEDTILLIGRWNDIYQKRPEFMMSMLEKLYQQGASAETRIFGRITESVRDWHAKLPEGIADKIKLKGYISNEKLRQEFNRAKVIVCTSRFEGSHIVSSEALCCGMSVVTTNRPKPLRTVHWYTSKNSGRISDIDTPESLAEAVYHELKDWKNGKRNPHEIAAAWQPYFHVDKVFKKIFNL